VRAEPLDVVRWALVDLDVSALATPESVVDGLADKIGAEVDAADGRILAVRARAWGASPTVSMRANPERWRNELLSRLMSVTGGKAWLEKLVLDIESPAAGAHGNAEGLAVLDRTIGTLVDEEAALPEFVGDIQRKVGSDLAGADEESPFSTKNLKRLRGEALELLRERLREGAGGGS
jgi:hypothetical protein